MKKMKCEVCGSLSIKKENGVFVCSECGTEYSLEDAKKLLTEIGDSTTEKVDKEQKREENNRYIVGVTQKYRRRYHETIQIGRRNVLLGNPKTVSIIFRQANKSVDRADPNTDHIHTKSKNNKFIGAEV